ncbi:MAG TPA: glycosyltransferase [Actinomycetota bacterium]|nr:glycosyltransferase [Actinomycetota bacterium]
MRILHYYPRATVGDGGPSIAARGWAEGMRAAGADVAVAFDAAVGGDGTGVVPVAHRGRGRARVPAGLREILPSFDLLVLHSGWVAHNVVAARAARRTGTPYVVTPHGAYAPDVVAGARRSTKRAWWRLLERPMLGGAAAVHVFFEEEVGHLREAGYEGEVVVAPNGVTVPEGESWDGGSGGYVLWLGRFDVRHKGLDLLVAAVAAIGPAARPSVRLHGPDWRGGRSEVARLVEAEGLAGSVSLRDPLYGAEKWEALRRARCFVYPSRWEVFGLAPAEAAAVGVPVIGTDTSPFVRHLADNAAALAVAPSAPALAAALRTDDAALAPLGARSASFVKEHYSWAAVGRRFLTGVQRLA